MAKILSITSFAATRECATVMPPHLDCGQHDGVPAHVWPAESRSGDGCRCGAHQLPQSAFHLRLPSAREAADEAEAC